MTVLDDITALERELAEGDGDTYRRLLRADAVVIVPGGQVLDAAGTATAIDASPGWDDVALEQPRLVSLGADAAALTYRFRGRRGADFTYVAQMTSAWTRTPDGWRLAVHQQTPE